MEKQPTVDRESTSTIEGQPAATVRERLLNTMQRWNQKFEETSKILENTNNRKNYRKGEPYFYKIGALAWDTLAFIADMPVDLAEFTTRKIIDRLQGGSPQANQNG